MRSMPVDRGHGTGGPIGALGSCPLQLLSPPVKGGASWGLRLLTLPGSCGAQPHNVHSEKKPSRLGLSACPPGEHWASAETNGGVSTGHKVTPRTCVCVAWRGQGRTSGRLSVRQASQGRAKMPQQIFPCADAPDRGSSQGPPCSRRAAECPACHFRQSPRR